MNRSARFLSLNVPGDKPSAAFGEGCTPVVEDGAVIAYEGEMTAEFRDAGRKWPDFVYHHPTDEGPRVLTSRRVLESLRRLSKGDELAAYRVLARNTAFEVPAYFYLSPRPGIEVEPGRTPRKPGDAFFPVEGSWSGCPVFTIKGYPRSGVFCSAEVVDLAVADKWSGVSFWPMDFRVETYPGWSRIDLGNPNWRDTSYPPEPEGRDLRDVLADLRAPKVPKGRMLARKELLRGGQEAADLVLEAFDREQDDFAKLHLAEVLIGLASRGARIPGEAVSAARAFRDELHRT